MQGLEFMVPLVESMVRDDPSKRPTINEVVKSFGDLQRSLPEGQLRSRMIYEVESTFMQVTRDASHFMTRTIWDRLFYRPPIPSPPNHPQHTFQASLASSLQI